MENTLIDASVPPIIRICDFGVARKVDKDNTGRPDFQRMNTFTGTPGSLSPQARALGGEVEREGARIAGAAALRPELCG